VITMKKGISSFVAAVLLIGFTVAVGAILSLWFTTFTRTQTAGIQTSAACHAGNIRLFSNLGNSPTNTVWVYVTNLRSDMDITVNSVSVTCGASSNTISTPFIVKAAQTNRTQVTGLSGCTISNGAIYIVANCSTGGSFTASCAPGTCGLY